MYDGKSKVQVLMGKDMARPSKIVVDAHFVENEDLRDDRPHSSKAKSTKQLATDGGLAIVVGAASVPACATYSHGATAAIFLVAGAVSCWAFASLLALVLVLFALGSKV